MAQDVPFVGGAVLHAAILGAFRASGRSFDSWCAENGLRPGAVRLATYGQSRGPKGQALLARVIEAAGPEVVRTAYLERLKSHVSDLKDGVA